MFRRYGLIGPNKAARRGAAAAAAGPAEEPEEHRRAENGRRDERKAGLSPEETGAALRPPQR